MRVRDAAVRNASIETCVIFVFVRQLDAVALGRERASEQFREDTCVILFSFANLMQSPYSDCRRSLSRLPPLGVPKTIAVESSDVRLALSLLHARSHTHEKWLLVWCVAHGSEQRE